MGTLELLPAAAHLELVAPPVGDMIRALAPSEEECAVAAIDPSCADTAAFCARYQIDPADAANCVVVKATRAGTVWYAACLVRASDRVDVNGTLRRRLDARKVSFAPREEAVSLARMEFGGITPLGLPPAWPVFIDANAARARRLVVGSGRRDSKLVVAGSFLARIPGATIIDRLVQSQTFL